MSPDARNDVVAESGHGGAAGEVGGALGGGAGQVQDGGAADAHPDSADHAAADAAGDLLDAALDLPDTGGGEATGPICLLCSAWGAPQALGVNPSVLPELSGIAASHLHPGIFYAHNDSGDTARFFAVTEQMQVNAEIHLSGATATDWEDISIGPCPGGACIYVGDTGDNKLDRSQYVIHRLVEPATLPSDGSVVSISSASYDSFPFVYPDGSHNAETLLVHPVTGQVFIVIKEAGIPATVYEMPLPLKPGQEVTLVKVASLAIPLSEGVVTDGSFHPCGDKVLIRTTAVTGLFELTRLPGQSLTDLFMAPPVMVPLAAEPQGEAVTYGLDGRSYFTGSETVSGEDTPSLSRVSCTSP